MSKEVYILGYNDGMTVTLESDEVNVKGDNLFEAPDVGVPIYISINRGLIILEFLFDEDMACWNAEIIRDNAHWKMKEVGDSNTNVMIHIQVPDKIKTLFAEQVEDIDDEEYGDDAPLIKGYSVKPSFEKPKEYYKIDFKKEEIEEKI